MIFKHRPKLGDVIYSLPFIKANGGGTLLLDPDSIHFIGQRDLWVERFKWLIPLIEAQDYIDEVRIYEYDEHYDFDLDNYMFTSHLTRGDKVNIVDNHFIGHKQTPPPYEKWLKVGYLHSPSYKVVANSNNHHNNAVNYRELLNGEERFVGTKQEAIEFYQRTGVILAASEFKDVLELAEVINAADVFIGNQSLPLAIALGLGKKCYVEESPLYPNCIMGDYIKL